MPPEFKTGKVIRYNDPSNKDLHGKCAIIYGSEKVKSRYGFREDLLILWAYRGGTRGRVGRFGTEKWDVL